MNNKFARLLLSVFRVFNLIVTMLVVFTYYQIQKNPFAYNDYADKHTWLPKVQEPQLRVYAYQEDTEFRLNSREYLDFLQWNQDKYCWTLGDQCTGQIILLANDTEYVYIAEFDSMDNMDMWGKCEEMTNEDTSEEANIFYKMYPGCSIHMGPQNVYTWVLLRFAKTLP